MWPFKRRTSASIVSWFEAVSLTERVTRQQGDREQRDLQRQLDLQTEQLHEQAERLAHAQLIETEYLALRRELEVQRGRDSH